MLHEDNVHAVADLQDRVDALARMAVLIDAGDFPGLVALQEQAAVLAADLDAACARDMAELARTAGNLAGSIVARSVADAGAAFTAIGTVIEQLQNAASRAENAASDVQHATATGRSSDEDSELIVAWIGDCDGTLTELEGRLLALERAPADREVVAEIRRMLHTLKGECGVLSLHAPQQLCHEAESLIDTCVDANRAVPIDAFLALLDWLKNFVTRLSADHTAEPDDHSAVMAKLIAPRSQAEAPSAAKQPSAIAQTSAHVATHVTAHATATPVAAPQSSARAAAAAVAPIPQASASKPAAPSSAPGASASSAPAPRGTPAVHVDASTSSALVVLSVQSGTEENLPEFLCEAKDHIANSEEALLALEQDRGNSELINTVFRAFHTIKGVSGFMAIQPIVELAHSAEQLLDGARSGAIQLGRGELDLILASCDMLSRLLAVLEGSPGPTRRDFEAMVSRLNTAASSATSATTNDDAAHEPAIEHEAPAVATQERAVARGTEPAASSAQPPVQAAPAEMEPSGNLKARKADQTVKVNTSRMDNLVTMVGELVIAQQMVSQDSAALGARGQRIQRTLSHMGKMIRDLQEVSMSLRMVNLKGTFQKMTRLVRDVSQKAGKQIELVTDGEDVELDRNVVEAITDPLVHMIRNACDHGLEPAADRRAAGKPVVGTVTLRAYHAGGSIVIEIADDGRGLRREKLIAKAKSKGLLAPDVNEDSLPDDKVFDLIFLPGFSTAEKVTDLSGRGVGMDVVRRNIEALRGKVEIRSTPGTGTTFLMRLPLTMAIIDGMVVRVGGQRYVLPTLSIQQSFRPLPGDVKTVVGAGEMVRVRDSMLPIYRLNRALQLTEGAEQVSDALLIVMEADDSRFCLLVDEILGQQQVVIKTLNQTGHKLRGVSGGAILGDGRVALILDVSQVVGLATERTESPSRAADKASLSGVGA